MKRLILLFLALILSGCGGIKIKPLTINYILSSGDSIDFTALTKNAQGAGSGLDLDFLDGINSTAFSQLGQTIESAEITDGTIVDADVSASAAIAATKISFSDPDLTYIATNVDAALAELNNTLAGGPNNGGMLAWSQLVSVPAGWADGDDAIGTAITFGVTSTDVSGSASSAGVDADGAREDHTHRGVLSLNKSGDTTLCGAVTISGGNLVTLTQSGQDVSISATGDDPELYISRLASDIKHSNDDTQTYFSLRNKLVDTVRDSSGINAGSSSNYTVRGTPNFDIIRNISDAIVVWNAFTASAVPSRFCVHTNTTPNTGSVTFDISRNGGTNYMTGVATNSVVDFTSTSGSSVVIRVNIIGDAELDDLALHVLP